MKAYDEIWGVAEDNFGIITSAQAEGLGVSRQHMVKMERAGLLTRLAHGVYQVKHHVPGNKDFYAIGVAMTGENAYLRGASVLGLLDLAPTDPAFIYIGCENRVRRRLPEGYIVKDRKTAETTYYDGVRCETLPVALREARREGVVEADRIALAAEKANEKGMLTDEECSEFKG